MRARSFSHCGITVSSFNRAVRFYWDVFGCPLVGVADTSPDRVRTFFGVDPGTDLGIDVGIDAAQPRCKIGWIRVPGGAVIEIFEFQPQLPPSVIPWNRVGLTHISFNVRNTHRWYDYLRGKGVACVSEPERSPRGHMFFFRPRFRRQSDRTDGSRLHAPGLAVAGPAGRLDLQAGHVSAVLRGKLLT